MDRKKRFIKVGGITLLVVIAFVIAGYGWRYVKPAATILDMTGMKASEIVKIELFNGNNGVVKVIEDEAGKNEIINYLQQSKFKYQSARPKGYVGFSYIMTFHSSQAKSGFTLNSEDTFETTDSIYQKSSGVYNRDTLISFFK